MTGDLRIQMSQRFVGPVAGDKDGARKIRRENIIPLLERDDSAKLILDFKDVEVATQSFIHACIAEAIQRWGENVLDRFEFCACNEEIKEVIATVVAYNVRAYELGRETPPGPIHSIDVPQADNLRTIRTVLDAMAGGDTYLVDLENATGYSYRHLHYRLHAARILGLAKVSRTLAILTESGFALTETGQGSEEEREAFVAAIGGSHVIKKLVPTLLSAKREPSASAIKNRIVSLTGMSENTAMRRARSMISWRRALLDRQLTFGALS